MINNRRQALLTLGLVATGLVPVTVTPLDRALAAPSPEDLARQADQALQTLYRTNQTAAQISGSARAVLIFPHMIKAGLVFGGSYGEGVLQEGSAQQGPRTVGYYDAVSLSGGLQAGVQSYGYALFLMNDKAVDFVRQAQDWELGVGATLVIVNDEVAKNLSASTLKDDAYAFVFDQEGLMVGVSVEGTKISRVQR